MKEKLMFQNAPHVRQSESVVTMMTDVIVALLPIYLMSFFYYGARSLVLGIVGAVSCAVFAFIGSIVLKEKLSLDLTPVITGLILPLLMPANIPYYILIAACSVAILVVKVPFGGTGNNLFNPAAVGFASVALCWPELVFRYPAPMQVIEIFGESTAAAAQSPAYSLAIGAVPDYEVLDMILGSVPGPMGATNIFVVVACGIFLIVKKAVNWMSPVSFLVPYAVLSMIFPRIGGSSFEALCYELFSGTVIFGAFFMLTEPVTSPKRDFGKLMAGITSAVAVFLFRYFGELEMGFANALILMNVFSPLFDTACEKILRVYRNKELLLKKLEGKKVEPKEEPKPVVRVLEKKEAVVRETVPALEVTDDAVEIDLSAADEAPEEELVYEELVENEDLEEEIPTESEEEILEVEEISEELVENEDLVEEISAESEEETLEVEEIPEEVVEEEPVFEEITDEVATEEISEELVENEDLVEEISAESEEEILEVEEIFEEVIEEEPVFEETADEVATEEISEELVENEDLEEEISAESEEETLEVEEIPEEVIEEEPVYEETADEVATEEETSDEELVENEDLVEEISAESEEETLEVEEIPEEPVHKKHSGKKKNPSLVDILLAGVSKKYVKKSHKTEDEEAAE